MALWAWVRSMNRRVSFAFRVSTSPATREPRGPYPKSKRNPSADSVLIPPLPEGLPTSYPTPRFLCAIASHSANLCLDSYPLALFYPNSNINQLYPELNS